MLPDYAIDTKQDFYKPLHIKRLGDSFLFNAMLSRNYANVTDPTPHILTQWFTEWLLKQICLEHNQQYWNSKRHCCN